MSEHQTYKVIGVNAVNPNWDGSPATLQPNDTNNMAPTPTGSLVLLSQNTSGQNSAGSLTVTSGGTIVTSETLYGNVNQPTVFAYNFNGSNMKVTNTSLPNTKNPIWVAAVAPGLPGVKPATLPMDGTPITLATGATAAGNASASYMQLYLQSMAGTLTVAVVIGGPPDASGNNALVISLNDPNGNTGPGTGKPAPAGYYATTSSNTYLYQFNWGSAQVFVANESPATAASLTVGCRQL